MPIYKSNTKHKGRVYRVQVHGKIAPGKYVIKRGTARTMTEAKKMEADLLSQFAITASMMTVSEGIQRYLEDLCLRVKLTTYVSAEAVLRKQIEPFIGAYKITEVTPQIIRLQLQNHWLTQGYKPAYISLLNSRASALFNYFMRFYNLHRNPVKSAGHVGARNSKEMSFWTLDEFNDFCKGLNPKDDISYYVLFQLLYYTGMRIGEAFALVPDDIDFNSHLIHITKTYVRFKGQDIIQPPKTRQSIRDISIPEFLTRMLAEYIKRLPDEKTRLFFNISKYSLWRKMRSVCKKTGVKLIRVHSIRHSAVAFLIDQGVPILEISKRCGHRSPDITWRVYSHLYPNREQSIAKLLDKVHESANENN